MKYRGPLEFFLSTMLILSCLSGFGLLEFFLSATLLLAVAVGSFIAFCWFCCWFFFSTRTRPGGGSS
jgi:hypothetical protein